MGMGIIILNNTLINITIYISISISINININMIKNIKYARYHEYSIYIISIFYAILFYYIITVYVKVRRQYSGHADRRHCQTLDKYSCVG